MRATGRLAALRPTRHPADRGRSVRRDLSGSLGDAAYEAIKHRIITCAFRPGAVLTEAQVCRDLKIGRTPIHQAFGRLMLEGQVEVVPRKGVVVRPVSLDEVSEIVEVRRATEVLCVALVIARASDQELAGLQPILDQARTAGAARDIETLMLLDREFHATLAQAARNRVLLDTLRNLHDRSLRFWFISLTDPKHHGPVLSEHEAIAQAVLARDVEKARAATLAHIDSFHRHITQQI